jgi:iron complex outermembrane receptor protein
MNLFKISVFTIYFCQAIECFSQQAVDTVLQLKPIEVTASRIDQFTSGNKKQLLDSSLLGNYSINNLADVLANQSQVFVKSYGLGSLATTSFRGAGANHTALLWNGFNIQSPMNGLVDMALVPSFFFNNVQLQYGGAGALWGTGAVGGTIYLNNAGVFNKGFSVFTNTSFGSFGDIQQQCGVEVSKKRVVSSIKLFNQDAKNNFPFINTALFGSPQEKQSNAQLHQCGFLQENYFKINNRQTLNVRFWYQFSDRNIPPSMTENTSVANQKDQSYRATAEWKRTGNKLSSIIRTAYFKDNLWYKDSSVNLVSNSKTNVFIAEAENRVSITKYDLLNIGVNNTFTNAVSADYAKNPTQNRVAVFANYKIHTKNNKWDAVACVRQEMVNNKPAPFTSSIGGTGNILKYFYINANAAKHYRLPTFNDLYWAQGGNPNLKAENGWSEEMGLTYKQSHKKNVWEGNATIFNRNINDWIVWLPNSYGIWSPDNVLKVWSRGVEYKVKLDVEIKKLKIRLSGLYNYVLSTNEQSASPNDPSIGKQLIYVPIQNCQGNITISYKGTSFMYTQVYTGYRYTTSDNTQYLQPYTIGNINVSQTISFNSFKIKLYAQLNNVWKETYQVMAYYAMPQFNYQFGLMLNYNQPAKTNKNQ